MTTPCFCYRPIPRAVVSNRINRGSVCHHPANVAQAAIVLNGQARAAGRSKLRRALHPPWRTDAKGAPSPRRDSTEQVLGAALDVCLSPVCCSVPAASGWRCPNRSCQEFVIVVSPNGTHSTTTEEGNVSNDPTKPRTPPQGTRGRR
jgi:hypothetical protein